MQQQAPSIRLTTVLPAQLSSSSGLECAGLCSVPPELQEQQHQVEQLWESLQQYMQDFEGLQRMVQHLVGSAGHPYAIDAAQLRAFAHAGELPAAAAAPAAGEGGCCSPGAGPLACVGTGDAPSQEGCLQFRACVGTD